MSKRRIQLLLLFGSFFPSPPVESGVSGDAEPSGVGLVVDLAGEAGALHVAVRAGLDARVRVALRGPGR